MVTLSGPESKIMRVMSLKGGGGVNERMENGNIEKNKMKG
jgi:hypothetical protein